MLDLIDMRILLIVIAVLLFFIMRSINGLAEQARIATITNQQYADIALRDLKEMRHKLVQIESKS